MYSKINFILLAFLISVIKLFAQTPNHIDDELPPINNVYKPGKIITVRDTITCFVVDRDNTYYNKGSIKYKMSSDASKVLKIKSKDVMHLEIEGYPPLDRFPYESKSYLMARLIDGEVKLYIAQVESMDRTIQNGMLYAPSSTATPVYTKNKSDKRFLVKENMIYEIDRINKYQLKRIFTNNAELNKEIENLTDQQILKNIEQLVRRYNSSVKLSTNEGK